MKGVGKYHILGVSESSLDSAAKTYSNSNGFELKYAEEFEFRMGTWFREVSIFKEGKEVTNLFFETPYNVVHSPSYDPFSSSGNYCFVENSPVVERASFAVIDTRTLKVFYFDKDNYSKCNQFSPTGDRLLVLEYHQLFIFNCVDEKVQQVKPPCAIENVVHARWLDDETIELIVNSNSGKFDKLIRMYLANDTYMFLELLSPFDVFTMDESQLTKCEALQEWTFVKYIPENLSYVFCAMCPVSSAQEDRKALNIEIEFTTKGSGVTKAAHIPNLEDYTQTVLLDQKKQSEPTSLSTIIHEFWSRMIG